MNREFAFGRNSTGGCACPAVAAGFYPDEDETLEAAEWYDDIVSGRVGGGFGTVGEDMARDVWIEVVDIIRARRDRDPAYEPAYLAARDVATELGWL